jgi:hypothetical protein
MYASGMRASFYLAMRLGALIINYKFAFCLNNVG